MPFHLPGGLDGVKGAWLVDRGRTRDFCRHRVLLQAKSRPLRELAVDEDEFRAEHASRRLDDSAPSLELRGVAGHERAVYEPRQTRSGSAFVATCGENETVGGLRCPKVWYYSAAFSRRERVSSEPFAPSSVPSPLVDGSGRLSRFP